jgi:paraquat-inducible protein B
MSAGPNDPTNQGPPPEAPEAKIRTPSRYSLVWLVPLIAAALAIYLGWTTIASRGPLIAITFPDGQGITAGETKVEYKAVAIGTVESVALTHHDSLVTASVRMSKGAADLLTSHARFWIVRPRFSLTDISGLQTLVSGSYIAIDPGSPGGSKADDFTGLSQPPGVRSDQPGETFALTSPRLGWLETGAPVFYRDIVVGHLLDYTDPGMGKPLTLRVFVKAPYDHYVRTETHFWNTSGLSMSFGPAGVHVAVESMEALLAGGIAFENFQDAAQSPPAPGGHRFRLYGSKDDAENAGFHDNIRYVAYFDQSVSGLQPGSAVDLYGIRVGTVTGTELQLAPGTEKPRVRVTFDIQPARVYAAGKIPKVDPVEVTRALVKLGMRARIDTANLVTGESTIGLDMVPDAQPAQVTTEGKRIVWPSKEGGFQNLTDSLEVIMSKLQRMPLDRMGDNANALLASLHRLSDTADNDLIPLGKKLPRMADDLQATLRRADAMLASMQRGYGANSATDRALLQVTQQASQTLESIRTLTNYLDHHPGSLVWGR